MQIFDFNQRPIQHLKGEIIKLTLPKGINPSVKAIPIIKYDLGMTYNREQNLFNVKGNIRWKLEAIDALNGHQFTTQESLDLDEIYSTNLASLNDADNFLDLTKFNFDDFLLDIVAINIPLVLSESHDIINKNGFGWEVLSESSYEENRDQNDASETDSRWDALDKWQKNK